MIVQHPTQTGYLITTDEVKRLIAAPFLLRMPDGTEVHPLHFTPVDFAADDVMGARQHAISEFANLKTQQQNRAGLTESMYHEAKHWQAQPTTPLSLNPGYQKPAEYVAWVIRTWEKIQSDHKASVSMVNQAKDVETIQIIMERRGV